VKGLSEAQQKSLILTINSSQRGAPRELSPLEVANLFKLALDAGETLGTLSEDLTLRSATMIKRFTRLLDLDPKTHHLVGWGGEPGKVSFSAATEVARLPRREHEAVFNILLERSFSLADAKQLIQRVFKAKEPVDRAADSIAALHPSVSRRHLILGLISDQRLSAKLRYLTQSERDALLKTVVLQIYPVKEFGGSLSDARLSISLSEEDARGLLREGGRDLEGRLVDGLCERIGLK